MSLSAAIEQVHGEALERLAVCLGFVDSQLVGGRETAPARTGHAPAPRLSRRRADLDGRLRIGRFQRHACSPGRRTGAVLHLPVAAQVAQHVEHEGGETGTNEPVGADVSLRLAPGAGC